VQSVVLKGRQKVVLLLQKAKILKQIIIPMEVNHRDFSLSTVALAKVDLSACRQSLWKRAAQEGGLYYSDMQSYKSIGKIVSSFGLKGEVILQHVLGKKTSLKALEVLFIENQKDEMLPYFIKSTRIKSENEIYLVLDGVDAKEKTKPIMQKQVWLTEDVFEKYAAKSSAISLLGFRILNDKNDLGEILEIIEQPHQLICRISLNDKEVLIPLHEETIRKIDKKNRIVHVELPEGLLDVYQ
jgi:16S rRNA processing protein RimM